MNDIEQELRHMDFLNNLAESELFNAIMILILLAVVAFLALWLAKQLKDRWNWKIAIAIRTLAYIPVALLMMFDYFSLTTLIGLVMVAVVEFIIYSYIPKT